jgi:hypothetical protein
MMVKITIELPDEEYAKLWWGWYLGGGGDQGFYATLENEKPDEEYDTVWWTGKRTIRYEKLEINDGSD